MLRITDLNPLGGIGANCLLLELGPFRIVVDAGINPKELGTAAMPAFALLRDKPVDFVILTHCHLDHLGSIPVLLREHPQALLLLSKPSESLAPRMLRNSYNVMMRQRDEEGVPEYPLYSRREVTQMRHRTFALAYGQPRFFGGHHGERLAITLHPAGHVPGAAGVTLDYGHRRLFLSGDVLFHDQHILRGARFPRDPVDTLVLETTRGATQRAPGSSRASEIERLLETVRGTLRGGGSVLIPAFAFGRMQEILTILHEALVERRELPIVPIFASGLGLDLCNYFDEISRQSKEVRFSRRILDALPVLKVPDNLKPGRAPKKPAIYVLSSGMIVPNTASYIAAAALLDDPRSTLCFVGYCDPASPGGEIIAAEEDGELVFDALDFKAWAKARIEQFDLSSHADREELLEFALSLRPRRVVLTHGDPPARAWFQTQLKAADPKIDVIDPAPLRTLSLD
ncbi:MAG: MBL fold metallo-hydrolase [Opitutales bacterium]